MYGERGRIGLIALATDSSVLPEYQRLMPPGVQVYAAPITLPRGEVTPQSLAGMLAGDELERAARHLVWLEPQIIVFACTSGSLVHGIGWDRTLSERITAACGLPATTTTTAVLTALRALGATSLTIATPYLPELNAIERAFFEGNGFGVAAIGGIPCATDPEIGRLGPHDARRVVAELDGPEADAIFISCTNWHVVEAIDDLEARHGKPVVTSNQAGAWAALRTIGIDEPVVGHGQLLTLPVAMPVGRIG